MSFVGLDLGTSGVRAVAYSVDGTALATVEHQLTLRRPAAGRAELDATEIEAAAANAIRRLTARTDVAHDPVRAISFSVQGEAVVPVGPDGEPCAPVIVSMDERGAPAMARFAEQMSATDFHRITGQPLHPMFSAFKIAAADGAWRDAAGYRCLGDYLTQRWTGEAVIDYGLAARTGLFDVDTHEWSSAVLDRLGTFAPWLEPVKLSRPGPSGLAVGTIRPAVATTLGLGADVVVALGTHDQAAAFLGCGGRPGVRSCISLGSSDCLTVGSRQRPVGFDATGFASYPLDDSNWVTLAGTAAGGWALEWFAHIVGEGSVGAVFDHLSLEPPALVVVPYLRGSGTLDNDPGATGTVHGLTLETTRPELARAFVEASGFEFAKIAAAFTGHGVDPGEFLVCGSGSRNADALAARASAFGRRLAAGPDNASCRGAAILAARSLGLEDGFVAPSDDDLDWVRPDDRTTDWYHAQRDRYVALCEATRLLTRFPTTTPHKVEEAPR